MEAFHVAVKTDEDSHNLCWQLEGRSSNKSSMCSSFQVTSCSENVCMMAVLMGQSSSRKHTLKCAHIHTHRPA